MSMNGKICQRAQAMSTLHVACFSRFPLSVERLGPPKADGAVSAHQGDLCGGGCPRWEEYCLLHTHTLPTHARYSLNITSLHI